VTAAVASVLAQTHADFELVAVDDGSTDGTADALAEIGDSRLRYVWQPNRGPAAARNAGVRLSRGSLLTFLDSDNRWLPDHLEVVTAALDAHPRAVLASTCPRFDLRGRQSPAQAELVDALPRLLCSNFIGYVSCVGVRREALLDAGGFDERLQVFEDADLWLRLAMLGPFSFVRRRTVRHQPTRGSQHERGRHHGEFVVAYEASARRALARLPELERPDAPELLARAKGSIQFARALASLRDGELGAAERSIAEACSLDPELSRDPGLVAGRLRYAGLEPPELLRCVGGAADLWPEPGSDTALFLRLYAATLALRCGRPRRTVALLARRPRPWRAGFLWRTFPVARQLAGARLEGLIRIRRGWGNRFLPGSSDRTSVRCD
jgi:hypothetical protein